MRVALFGIGGPPDRVCHGERGVSAAFGSHVSQEERIRKTAYIAR